MFDHSECNSFRTERHKSVKPNHQQEQTKKRQKGFRRKVFFFSLLLQMVNPAAHFSHSESTLIRREAAETLMKRRAGDRSAGAGLTAVIRERNG